MKARKITTRQLRERQRDVIDQVCFHEARYIITRHGKKVAVLISPKDLQFLQRAIELIEDEVDVREADINYAEYLKTGKTKSLKQVAKELEIDV